VDAMVLLTLAGELQPDQFSQDCYDHVLVYAGVCERFPRGRANILAPVLPFAGMHFPCHVMRQAMRIATLPTRHSRDLASLTEVAGNLASTREGQEA
jgi:hypothetical protein